MTKVKRESVDDKVKRQFERLWNIVTTPKPYDKQMINVLDRIGKWDKYFGIK